MSNTTGSAFDIDLLSPPPGVNLFGDADKTTPQEEELPNLWDEEKSDEAITEEIVLPDIDTEPEGGEEDDGDGDGDEGGEEGAEPSVVETPKEDAPAVEEENIALIMAKAAVEDGILREDQVADDIDLLRIKELVIENAIEAADKTYDIEDRVNQRIAQLGYTKENKEYVDYLLSNGEEKHVRRAGRIDKAVSADLDLADDDSEEVDFLLRVFLEEKGVAEDMIDATISGIKAKDETQRYVDAAKKFLPSRKSQIITEHKAQMDAERERILKSQEEAQSRVRNAVEEGVALGKKLDVAAAREFKEAVYAKTERVKMPDGSVQRLSKLEAIYYEASNDPAKLRDLYYKVLYADTEAAKAKEEGAKENSKRLLELSNRERTTTKNTTRSTGKMTSTPYVSLSRQ